MISILCPTRNRPENVRRLVSSAHATMDSPVEFVFREDDDACGSVPADIMSLASVTVLCDSRTVLSSLWNECAEAATGDIMMHCGDDIVFQSKNWDTIISNEFQKHSDGILLAYGNDLLHGEKLSTHGFIHRNWVSAVGYFTAPYFSCDYGDTWLFDVAGLIGRRAYLPEVITEHMHPSVGKAEWDLNHQERVARGAHDNVEQVYRDKLPERKHDAEKLRAVMVPQSYE